jgi:hypothetical protein
MEVRFYMKKEVTNDLLLCLVLFIIVVLKSNLIFGKKNRMLL